MIYIIIFHLSTISIWFENKFKKKFIKKIFIYLSSFFIIALTGFRYYVGTDYGSYVYIFKRIENMNFKNLFTFTQTEVGHNVLCKLISVIGLPYQAMFFAYAILTTYFIYKIMKKEKLNNVFFLLSYLCMIFCYSMNIMRQVLAMVIILYSLTFLFEGKKRKSILYLLLAASFHTPSLIILPIYLLQFFVFNKKVKNWITAIIYIIITILFMTNLTSVLSIDSLSRYSSYSSSNGFDISFLLGTVLKKLPILILLLYNYKNIEKQDSNLSLYSTIFIIGFIFSILGGINSTLNRLSLYFSIIDIYLIGKITNKTNMKIQKISLYGYLIFYFFFQFYHNNIGEIFPYRTWL